ncbi:MAG: hypothetical protein M5U26_20585 [Planctomycetota bacterium]|nr:hypothetical protein [Planctomycetota bacterium]
MILTAFIGLILVFGPLGFTYLAIRNAIERTVVDERPTSALVFGYGAALFCLFVTGVVAFTFMLLWVIGMVLWGLAGLVGACVMAVETFRLFANLGPYRAWRRAYPPPRLQATMSDLFTAIFLYALAMALLAAAGSPADFGVDEAYVVGWAIYLAPAAAFGLYAALDAIRETGGAWPSARRMRYVALLVVLNALLPGLAQLVWLLWRRGLWRVAKKREAERKAIDARRVELLEPTVRGSFDEAPLPGVVAPAVDAGNADAG